MDEIEDLSDLPMPRFIWGFAVIAGKSGEVMHDEFEYLTHTRSPRFTCRVVELEDMPAESDEDAIDGRIVHHDDPRRMFYITDAGMALVNFQLSDKMPDKQKFKRICDEAIANWMLRREFLDEEEED
ncbi:hypothetical protein [Cupriavidus oxalaticus]|jgi:hypothetical protein|uniref:Uncharacterized protein n=1 Tax=Cupriavidus oxalaticus TaxID=96344 RepID=A0A375G163_9BURK|nr:hypothetical protein [Cupriavidus oxalaticus]QEZ47160.1 hypothetical protein D2917_23700 [Cupriavidus oxalaticus]QRQ88532.1 hypothetical protein JTE91_18365 [Cupriavidus oxalaticus]QRQ93142.1 hypothetical protein JTE92_23895 [Cupriavidus oxalaticus]WQD81752.1 hypothetical protein U0036_11630 [Cupriavidus oxalaticus]SPC13114.1 conserved hypothetical protein [Cupriavidus oxalaticus]